MEPTHLFVGIIFGAAILLMLVLSFYLLSGRGANLIAGYNTLPETEKAKYDKPRLCRSVGVLMLQITAAFCVLAIGILIDLVWLIVSGAVLFAAVIIVGLVRLNTDPRIKK